MNISAKTLIYAQLYIVMCIGLLIGAKVVPDTAIYITDLINLILFVKIAQNNSCFYKLKIYTSLYPIIILSMLLAIALFSWIINGQSVAMFAWEFRSFFRYYIYFFSCVLFLNKKDIFKILKILRIFLYSNFIASVIQYFIFNITGDENGGLFGITTGVNAGVVLFCCIMLSYYLLGYFKKYVNIKQLAINLFIILSLSILAEIKFLMYIILGFIILSIIMHFRSNRSKYLIGLSCIILLVGAFLILSFYSQKYFDNLFNADTVTSYVNQEGGYNFDDGGLNRGIAISKINDKFYYDNNINKYIGFGLGSCSVSTVIPTAFYAKYSYMAYHFFLTSYILLEQGWIGFILYVLFFISIIFACFTIRKRFKNKFIFDFTIAVILLAILNIWYNASLRSNSAYLIYLVLAFPFILYKEYILKFSKNEKSMCEYNRTGVQCRKISRKMPHVFNRTIHLKY